MQLNPWYEKNKLSEWKGFSCPWLTCTIRIAEGCKSVWWNPNFAASKLLFTSKDFRFHLRSCSYLGLILSSIISFFKWRKAKGYLSPVKHTRLVKQRLCHFDMSQRKQDLTQVAMELQIINILLEILEQLYIYLSPTHRRICLITVTFIFILDFYTGRNTLRFQMSYFSNWATIAPAPLTIRCLQCT